MIVLIPDHCILPYIPFTSLYTSNYDSIYFRMSRSHSKLGVLSRTRYDTLLQKVEGKFETRGKDMNEEQVRALFQFKRWKKHLGVRDGRLTYNGKLCVKNNEVDNIIKQEFERNCGMGYRTMYYKLKETYYGISVRQIKRKLETSENYQKQYPRFMNKPRPKTVTAKRPSDRWQADLIEMRNDAVSSGGRTFNYVLQVIDVYSRFIMTRPLVSKTATNVAKALQEIMFQHGPPRILQTDRGTEFQAEVKTLCSKYDIRVICSSPYHPQSQGKCERANKTLKEKIRNATMRLEGFNWVEGLQEITSIINRSPKRILGNHSPFDVYYARGDISLSSKHRRSLSAHKNLQRIAKKSHAAIISRSKSDVSQYKTGEQVFIKYPFRRCRIPKKRHIIRGEIVAKKKNDYKYMVKYVNPKGNEVKEWIGVENITSKTVEIELKKQKNAALKKNNNERKNQISKLKQQKVKRRHRSKFYKVLDHNDKLRQLNYTGDIEICYDPSPDGNCQFSALSNQLGKQNLFIDHMKLREMAVSHISENIDYYSYFVVGNCATYLEQMRKIGTFGDHLTLLALTRELNIQCLVLSAAGIEHTAVISNDGVFHEDMTTLVLGYFPENMGMHYVSLDVQDRDSLIVAARQNNAHFLEDDHAADNEPVSDRDDKDDNDQDNWNTNNTQEESDEDCRSPDSEQKRLASLKRNVDLLRQHKKCQREMKKKNAPTILQLPPEILTYIIKLCIVNYPHMRCVLDKVSTYFYEMIKEMKIPSPQIHIAPSVMGTVPNTLSVRKIIRRAGSKSGLAIEIRQIIKDSRWINAWLALNQVGIDWYEIKDILFKK